MVRVLVVITAAALAASGTAVAGDGAAIWHGAGCGSCHTLAASGSTGTFGPNLDQAKPTAADVVTAVTNGVGKMPSFAHLGWLNIDDLAVYVASAAGGSSAGTPPAAATTATSTTSTTSTTAKPTPAQKPARVAKPAVLAPAAHSPAVRRLQRQLQRIGFFDGPVTGLYGNVTTAAVRHFQKSVGLTPDGIWGPKSKRALAHRLQKEAAVRRVAARAASAPLPPPKPWVKLLQAELRRLGYFHHPVTGVYGPVTTTAVARFQLRMGLRVDGMWGPKSQRALVRRLSATVRPRARSSAG